MDYRSNGRDFQSSTLSVPDQVMSSNHCSRSSDINRARSRSPSVPPPSSHFLTLPRTRHTQPRHDHQTEPSRNHEHHPPLHRQHHRVAPLCREEAVRLLRSTRMARTHSEGAYSSDGDHERY
ncbi:unnamed protein product [Boreogadus saida]